MGTGDSTADDSRQSNRKTIEMILEEVNLAVRRQ
jgi:hypothetical protein